MNILTANPFQDPRAADSLNGDDYVRCFSDYLVHHLPEVFAQGNVILRGTLGCGKSMILRLFDPKVRIAYHDLGKAFPIPAANRRFVGAGVNLSKSGILDIIQRFPANAAEEDVQRLTSIFADYLNYWLADDLLASCELMMTRAECFEGLLNETRCTEFVKMVTAQRCWFGYLADCKTLGDLRKRIDDRLVSIRSWANWNADNLPKEIEESKTVIGEPVASMAAALKESGVLDPKAVVFVRIDQLEELLHKDLPQAQLTEQMRRRIYLALGRRDGRLSYRIGTRTYDNDTLVMPGGRLLEESRDYIFVEFDSLLRRGENPKNWLFKGFADEVFKRRVHAVFPHGDMVDSKKGTLCRRFFGSSPGPEEAVANIVVQQDTPVDLLVKLERLPNEWREYVKNVYNRETALSGKAVGENYKIDPLNAILAAAWAQQNGGKVDQPRRCDITHPPALTASPPWTKWWQKERVRQATLQLAARHKQRLLWWGIEHILSLSSNNITLFLSLCRETWELWQRDLRASSSPPAFSEVPVKVQQVAIDNVSKRWHQNFAKQPGRPGGDARIRFLDRVFGDLRVRLRSDEEMRYPGANGFSVLMDDVASIPMLKQLLDECVAWGDLECITHTSKHSGDKKRGRRNKYYANSILAPHYQIFESHTKEPRYMKSGDLLKFAQAAHAVPADTGDMR